MLQISDLLTLCAEYQRVCQVADSTLSTTIFNDGKKLAALKADKDMHTKRFNGAVQWFSDNWPEGAVWPKGVARPRIAA